MEHHCTAQVSDAHPKTLTSHKPWGLEELSSLSCQESSPPPQTVWGPNTIPLQQFGDQQLPKNIPALGSASPAKQLKALGRARVLLETFLIRSIDLPRARLGF